MPREVEPALPAWKAFVVQFTKETGARAGVCSGRVEHLASGQRSSFDSRDELFRFVEVVLADEEDPRQ